MLTLGLLPRDFSRISVKLLSVVLLGLKWRGLLKGL